MTDQTEQAHDMAKHRTIEPRPPGTSWAVVHGPGLSRDAITLFHNAGAFDYFDGLAEDDQACSVLAERDPQGRVFWVKGAGEFDWPTLSAAVNARHANREEQRRAKRDAKPYAASPDAPGKTFRRHRPTLAERVAAVEDAARANRDAILERDLAHGEESLHLRTEVQSIRHSLGMERDDVAYTPMARRMTQAEERIEALSHPVRPDRPLLDALPPGLRAWLPYVLSASALLAALGALLRGGRR